MLSLIPPLYRWLTLLALVAAAGLTGWIKGAASVQDEWDLANAKTTDAIATAKAARAEQTVQVVTRYVDRIKTVTIASDQLFREIPRYVTPDDYPLPGGFRVLHDAAVAGRVPDPAGAAYAAPVAAADATRTVISNYAACQQNTEQLIALQDWINRMAAVQ
ncbi:MAG: hypothetical protein EG825_07710 [Rhodocyclaceae bacterium]|nr:hypothetical protein [Rhodocyclaceae bacterium]